MSGKPKRSGGDGTNSLSSTKSVKEAAKKIDELNETIELLKNENEQIKTKLKLICRKIVENVDLSQYDFLDPNTEPDLIDVKDLIHMIQRLALMATQINTKDNIETHMETLECRITELTNENSVFFKNKLKLQERLEFIMQERDVWKRNAETLKKMYTKLVKEQKSQLNSTLPISKCFIGTHRANIDTNNPNQRTFTATVPREYYENLRNVNIDNIQLTKLDQKLLNQLSQIKSQTSTPRSVDSSDLNFFVQTADFGNNNNNKLSPNNSLSSQNNTNLSLNSDSLDISSRSLPSPDLINTDPMIINNHYQTNNNNSNSNNNNKINGYLAKSNNVKQQFNNNSTDIEDRNSITIEHTTQSTNIEVIDRPMTAARKNVSFNKDIDVRIYPKNSKNSKVIESYLLPLAQQSFDQTGFQEAINQNQNNNTLPKNSISPLLSKSPDDLQLSNNNQAQFKSLLNKRNSANDISNSIFTLAQRQTTNSSSIPNLNTNNSNGHSNGYSNGNSNGTSSSTIENRFTSRASICSNKKFPGETPVKDLEPTLKMIIIKELSAEKLDGNDWRVFAKRIGINENEIREWTSLKLQYPMARVLSFWSSKPEATIRLLHRHLNAPCFNYGPLAKRIENFYDVL